MHLVPPPTLCVPPQGHGTPLPSARNPTYLSSCHGPVS